MEGLAGALALAGKHADAARMLGSATRAREAVGAPLPPPERGDVNRITSVVRTALGASAYGAEFGRGTDATSATGSAAAS